MLGSPPPFLAAMMIARLSLLQSLPRLASMAPFLCLIVAQWEWPDIGGYLLCCRPPGGPGPLRRRLPQFLLNFLVAFVLGPGAGVEQFQRLAPGRRGLAFFPRAEEHVAQVVEDHRVVVAVRQGGRL